MSFERQPLRPTNCTLACRVVLTYTRWLRAVMHTIDAWRCVQCRVLAAARVRSSLSRVTLAVNSSSCHVSAHQLMSSQHQASYAADCSSCILVLHCIVFTASILVVLLLSIRTMTAANLSCSDTVRILRARLGLK